MSEKQLKSKEGSNDQDKNNRIIIYDTQDGETKVEVLMKNETVWLSQKQMAELFDKDTRTVNEHIKNVFSEQELEEDSTIRKFRIVQKEGERTISRDIDHYNLDVIISVGYRVKSLRGTQFRIWATQKLKEYIVKGFVMDDERLAEGRVQKTYFEEWEERIRRIRNWRNIITSNWNVNNNFLFFIYENNAQNRHHGQRYLRRICL